MARLPDLVVFARAARPEDRHDRRPDPATAAAPSADRARRRAPARRRRTARSGSSPTATSSPTRRTSRWCAGRSRPDTETLVRVHEPLSVLDLLDAADASALVEHSRRRSRAIAEAGRGVVVLLHRPESRPHELRRRAIADDAAAPPPKMDLRNYGIGAQILRDLGVGRMRLLAQPAQDAEHGGLRPRGHRLRRAAAPRRRVAALTHGRAASHRRRARAGAVAPRRHRAGALQPRRSATGLLAGALRALERGRRGRRRHRRRRPCPARWRRRSRCSGSRRPATSTRWSRSAR